MDWELKSLLKGKVLGKLYRAFFDGKEEMNKKDLLDGIHSDPSDLAFIIDFLWDRENIKFDPVTDIVKITLKGILVVEYEELADKELIKRNITLREELITTFYELSEENEFNQVDSSILAERIGVENDRFPIHFQVIELMNYGSALINGDVLITTEGREYVEENYE